MDELFEKSKKIQDDATKLLNDSKLIEFLSKFGKVEMTGSYVYDLMMSGDIDIEVFGNFTRESAKKILNELISKTDFTGYMFFDWVKYNNPKWPHGYYIGIKQIIAGYSHQWKIDIWLIKKNRNKTDLDERLQNIDQKTKKIILALKNWTKEKDCQSDSMPIYNAVINCGVKNIEDYQKYLKTV